VVSSGQEEVRVPSVVGLTQSEATNVLQDAGFQVAVDEATVLNPTSSGRVISQTPTAGSRVAKGSTVRITVGRLGTTNTTASSSTTTTSGGILGN
jgi:serine/threonine-protein kinase